MTSRSRIGSTSAPPPLSEHSHYKPPIGQAFEPEHEGVETARELASRMGKIGARQLLLRRLDWNRLYVTPDLPGAIADANAGCLTRYEAQVRWQNQKAFRSGPRGLLAAVMAA